MCMLCGNNPSDQAIDHTIDHPFDLAPDTDHMCAECGVHVSAHPDKLEWLKKQEMEHIIDHGHQVRYIFGDDGPNFAYSVGRCAIDESKPEFLVYGDLPPEVMQYMVNRVAEIDDERRAAGEFLDDGDVLDTVLEGYEVALVRVRDLDKAQMFGVTQQFSTANPWALQILWPDAEHRWPGDPDFTYGPDAQPVFA